MKNVILARFGIFIVGNEQAARIAENALECSCAHYRPAMVSVNTTYGPVLFLKTQAEAEAYLACLNRQMCPASVA
jgi:hypothetical protein